MSKQTIRLLPDDEVLALANSEMEADSDHRFSELLDKQQRGTITESERIEILNLMQSYQIGLLAKAKALSECVRRGLMEPLPQ